MPEDKLKDEEPALLDPFDPDDWRLIWFDDDGKPEPIPGADETGQFRVRKSIEIFHLHETRILRARNDIRLKISNTVKDLNDAKKKGDREKLQNAKSSLMEAIRDAEKLSRAAIIYLCKDRAIPEVKEILMNGGVID